MTIGNLIETYQREHMMSEREFAKRCGVSNVLINSLKKGRTSNGKTFTPSIDTLRKVAAGMGISTQALLMSVEDLEIKWEERDTAIPPERMEIINSIIKATPEQFEKIKSIISLVMQ